MLDQINNRGKTQLQTHRNPSKLAATFQFNRPFATDVVPGFTMKSQNDNYAGESPFKNKLRKQLYISNPTSNDMYRSHADP